MGRKAETKKRQQAWRRYEAEIRPALERVMAPRPIPGLFDPIRDLQVEAAAAERPKVVRKLMARLVDPRVKEDAHGIVYNDTSAILPPTEYYVIVGRGAAAVVDHTTLRQGANGRLRDLPVVHIGFRDPWLAYHRHGMGQPPFLLRMPGFHAPPASDAETIRTGLRSDLFAASTAAEMDLLLQRYETYVVEGWVAAIESRRTRDEKRIDRAMLAKLGLPRAELDERLDSPFPKTFPRYRILFATPKLELFLVYAAKVDLCNGGGGGRTKPREPMKAPKALIDAATTKPWNPPYLWADGEEDRQIIHGLDGLSEATNWADGTRVCVYGSGGIGLNQIERAHDEREGPDHKKIWIDWYGRDFLHEPTFNLRRNDMVLKSPTKRRHDPDYPFMDAGEADALRLTPDTYQTKIVILPGSPFWRWTHHSKIRSVMLVPAAPKAPLRIELYLPDDRGGVPTLALASDPVCDDFWGKVQLGWPARSFRFSPEYEQEHPDCLAVAGTGNLYHRLILCLGQQQDLPGEPKSIAPGFTFSAKVYDGRMVCLEADKGGIRILGAAAVMFGGFGETQALKRAYDAMVEYRKGLPASSVPPGFILMGANIAAANGFFTNDEPNCNFNTASETELTTLIGRKNVAPLNAADIAKEIVNVRRWPNNGLESIDDLAIALTQRRGRWAEHLEALLEGLSALAVDYRPPDDWG